MNPWLYPVAIAGIAVAVWLVYRVVKWLLGNYGNPDHPVG